MILIPNPDAPDFEPGYPSRGELIGPAWREAWTRLRDMCEHSSETLIDAMTDYGIAERTAGNLLRQARVRGLLTVRYAGKHKRAHYTMARTGPHMVRSRTGGDPAPVSPPRDTSLRDELVAAADLVFGRTRP